MSNMLRSVYETDDYGQIYLDIDKLIKEKANGTTYNKLSNLMGTDFDLISRYANNKIVRADLDIIARFCYVFNCLPEEIIKYKAPNSK